MRLIATLLAFASLLPRPAAADVYKENGKDVITYTVSLPPKRAPAQPAALWLGFHGRGGNEGQLIAAMTAGLQKAGMRDDVVVIGLKSKADGWENADDEPVRKFVTYAIKNWNIDPRRIYGLGFSSGAFYMNRYAPNNSDLFAGAITYVGGQGGITKAETPENKAELYWVVGLKDTTVKAESVRPNAQAFLKAGFRAVYREMGDLGHEVAKEPTFEEAIQWMKVLRNKEVAPKAAEGEFLEKFSDPAKSASMLSESSTWTKAVAIGGHAAAPVVLAGLQSDRESAKSGAAQACARMMFDAKVVEALAALLDDKEAKVRQHALAALTFQGKWSYFGAQEALCAFAKDAKRAAGERKLAVAGLSEIVKIDLLGGFQLHKVLWALVDLLDTDEGGVRQMAFLALKGVDAAGFGYAPGADKDKRAAALEKWTSWAKKVCGEHP